MWHVSLGLGTYGTPTSQLPTHCLLYYRVEHCRLKTFIKLSIVGVYRSGCCRAVTVIKDLALFEAPRA